MQVSFYNYKPFVYSNKINNNSQKHNTQPHFTSGYGADDWGFVDTSELENCSEAERWKNIAKAIKQMTYDAYMEAHGGRSTKKELLYSPEECEKARKSFYEGTPLEGVDTSNRVPKDDPYKFVFDPYDYDD